MGSLTLPEAGLVYLDANGFIYSVERIEPYRTLLSPIWEQAAQLRAATGLKTPDAVHAATALVVGASLFVTNDPAFRRVDNLPVTVLSELMEGKEAEASAPDGENSS